MSMVGGVEFVFLGIAAVLYLTAQGGKFVVDNHGWDALALIIGGYAVGALITSALVYVLVRRDPDAWNEPLRAMATSAWFIFLPGWIIWRVTATLWLWIVRALERLV